MDKIFQIGDFTFRLCCPEEIMPPPNFMLFERGDTECALEKGSENSSMKETAEPEYTYRMHVAEELPVPEGKVIARRPDLTVYECGNRESRLIGVKGTEGYYACYRENDLSSAEITFAADRIGGLHIDPVFSSLLALERRLVKKDSMILHCAYVEYQGEAILFSAPSETGKTTQATLWDKYRGSRTVNGDRSLLGKKDGRWTAQGWPVCGTSEVCHDEAFPIRAIVMLSQADENRAVRMTPGQAFPLVYSQITVNRWNREEHIHTMDLIQDLLESVPVYHLGCTISEEAVECLARILEV